MPITLALLAQTSHARAQPDTATAGDAATYSSACPCVNADGRAQQWQTAPDDALPADFHPGGTLRLVWSAEPPTLTPFVGRDVYAAIVHQDVLEKLVWRSIDPPFDYVPGLARSWSVSDDGLTVEFELFSNARWSDGRPVTAADVVFTLNWIMRDEVAAPIERELLRENVSAWWAVDAHTVRFELRRPYFDAVGICGNRLWILPEHVYSTYTPEQFNTIADLCVGSGPWVLQRWDRGRALVLARNERYWGPKPAIERIHIRFETSARRELDLFLSGEVDLIGPTAEQWLAFIDSDALAGVGRGVQYETPLRGYTWIGYNLRRPMFDDARTRTALTMLLNRQEMVTALLGGLGRVISGPFHPQSRQYDHAIDPLPFDPKRAQQLLHAAGWMDTDGDGVLDKDLDGDGRREPLRFTFLAPSSELLGLVQRTVRQQFAVAGIDVQLDSMAWSAYVDRVAGGDFEMIMQRSAGGPETDAFEYWHSTQSADGRNIVGLRDARVDELINAAQTQQDHAARLGLWRQLHARLHELQPQTFLWTTPRLAFVNHRVRGVQPRVLRLYTSEWYIVEPSPNEAAAVEE